MPQKGTWITVRVEVHSTGSCTSYIQILGDPAIDDLLVREKVIRKIFLRVGSLCSSSD